MQGRERTRTMADARHAVWLLLYDHVGYSYNDIARIYQRDHTTIAHGVKRIRRTPVHKKILEGIKSVDAKLLDPLAEKRRIRPADTWEFDSE